MLDFGTYRGLFMLTTLDLCLRARRFILTLAGTAIDFVADRLTAFVLFQCFRTFFGSEIATVPINLFLFSGKKLRGYSDIVLVGCCYLYCMNQPAFLIHVDMGFVAKMPGIALLC